MKQFTDAEKQILQAKIKDQQERRASKKESTASKYGFLGIILCLLAFNVFLLLKRQHFGFDQYGNLVVALMLLFNHIAFDFTTSGWQSRVMKTTAVIWIVLVFAYGFWVL